MTTKTEEDTKTEFTVGRRKCPGCPRCNDGTWCKGDPDHQRWNNLHPICKVCGHCVLRGTHLDDITDLQVWPMRPMRKHDGI